MFTLIGIIGLFGIFSSRGLCGRIGSDRIGRDRISKPHEFGASAQLEHVVVLAQELLDRSVARLELLIPRHARLFGHLSTHRVDFHLSVFVFHVDECSQESQRLRESIQVQVGEIVVFIVNSLLFFY